jgi:hypothetical protein
MQVTPHDLGTGLLIYLCAGALLWVLLDAFGIIEATFIARTLNGRRPSGFAMALASVTMILAWPWFIWSWLRGMCRRTAR